ncbi:MAG TPA: ribosome silencing factor [Candidatus Paceibacterota bacterium]|nr:ribosome silencing factor [Verrucomicrobiota bacterium]HOX03689.1 ribosome silencing factor [Verrucomicrobiota bacterium]HRZ46603.1 ribosome silencing factor [Candidatus Paceibacterota bacterium]HRZ91626.1 ribosome silencing factor [Candidatus Paceibacterota bacterium]
MDSRKLARLCWESADEKKAERLVVLDVRRLSSITDYFIIASGSSEPHLRAIIDHITEKARIECGLRPRAIDGSKRTPWVVLDFQDVVVHIMRDEVRARYDLEHLWNDAPRVRLRRSPPRNRAASPPPAPA